MAEKAEKTRNLGSVLLRRPSSSVSSAKMPKLAERFWPIFDVRQNRILPETGRNLPTSLSLIRNLTPKVLDSYLLCAEPKVLHPINRNHKTNPKGGWSYDFLYELLTVIRNAFLRNAYTLFLRNSVWYFLRKYLLIFFIFFFEK
jgi:hypothetical protein